MITLDESYIMTHTVNQWRHYVKIKGCDMSGRSESRSETPRSENQEEIDKPEVWLIYDSF